jgi:uncharacterized short protein YbdD (DUF466 family)
MMLSARRIPLPTAQHTADTDCQPRRVFATLGVMLKLPRSPSGLTARWAGTVRQLLRSISGDSAYEAYLAHWCSSPRHETDRPLSRKEFFRARTVGKWRGINRCC